LESQAGQKQNNMQQDNQSKPKGLPRAQAAKAAELVNYQDGAIVSREIVKKPTGSVTIFAFDEGQGLSEHTAPFDALVQVLEGEVEIMISGKPHRLRDGELILMPANQPHALKAPKRFKMILTMIRS
jgi:quercetin dioxygenase-like cupin family protein